MTYLYFCQIGKILVTAMGFAHTLGQEYVANWHDLPQKQVPGESTEENNHENVKRKHKRLKTNTAFKNVLTS